MIRFRFFPAIVLLTFLPSAQAKVTINPIFGDHMVLQRERTVPVWGKADPGEKVLVSFAGQIRSTIASSDGKWMVHLDAMPVSEEPRSLIIEGKNKIELSDVLVGDVWLGSGQSNMDLQMYHTKRADEVRRMPAGTFDGIRLFIVKDAAADAPQDEIAGGNWKESTTENVMTFSATLFYFGEELHRRMPEVPLGLIRSSVGATHLFSWVPNEVRDKDHSARYLRNWWATETNSWTPGKQMQWDREMANYQNQVKTIKQGGGKLPVDLKQPSELIGPNWSRRPSGYYNGMIAPLQPLAIRGLIWYQGEWDCAEGWTKTYHDLFVAFARSLRAKWEESVDRTVLVKFPIYIVQLPARTPADENARFWPYLREAEQRMATDVPNSGYVVTYDTNDPKNMHPIEKTPVGQRLAWLALGKEYGRNIAWHGPELESVQVDVNGLLLTFDVGAAALVSKDKESLRNFEVAGKDGIFHPAMSEICGSNQVFIFSAEVSKARTARYAFVPSPESPNLYNSAGLPAGPFRSDDEPVP